jgi:5''-3'' exonuclease (including N-terminal domain of PolI)
MRLLLVDGHYFLYRSFFAIRGLTNSKGEPTNAIYGFTKALRRMIADVKPDRGAVVWDRGIPERRTALQPAYKQNRPSMPDEMRAQEGFMQELVPLLGMASLSLPDTEADDLIGSYAVQHPGETVIATNDKDILQLVNGRVRIYSTNKVDLAPGETFALLGEDAVRAKWGVDPGQIGDVLALTGDSSDNIPGVDGVGLKTAAALIREFGSVEALLENVDRVSSARTREKLIAQRQQVIDNRRMVALDLDLVLPVAVEDLRIEPRYPELIEALRRCEFKGLLAEIEREAAGAGSATAPQSPVAPPSPPASQAELF